MGAYTPLSGFMGEEDWQNCCLNMSISNIKNEPYKYSNNMLDPGLFLYSFSIDNDNIQPHGSYQLKYNPQSHFPCRAQIIFSRHNRKVE